MECVRFFHDLTYEQKDAITSVLITQKYFKNQNIVQEGDPASSFFIIKKGVAQVVKGNKEIRKLQTGDSFGEQALFYNTMRQTTIIAIEEVVCLVLGRDTLTKVLGDQVHVVTFRNLMKHAFEKNHYFKQLIKAQTDKVLDIMKIVSYKQGDSVYKKGTQGNQKIIVVIEGSIKKAKGNYTLANKGMLWGDIYQLEEQKNKILDDDIIMESDGVLAEINNDNFMEAIGGKLQEVISQNHHSKKRYSINNKLKNKSEAQKIKLEELILIQRVGLGQFGPIYLVKSNQQNQLYILKSFKKQLIQNQNVEKYFDQERQVLQIISNKLIIEFMKTFNDNEDIHFLVEYIKGIELFEVIRDIGLLSTYDSQFYTASIILIIEYLHSQGIIYRDVKPENFMVDQDGYLKLIDLGTSKLLKSKGKASMFDKTYTIIGTPHYMAREIIIGKGYNMFVDLWSLGICLFEFMTGIVPFGEDDLDPYNIYDKIIKLEIDFSPTFKDKKAKKLIEQLLNKVPELRLRGDNYDALKNHSWFENFDWEKLQEKEIQTPYKPNIDKLISDQFIKNQEKNQRLVIHEIQEDQKSRDEKEKFKQNGNWDKNFI